MYYDLSEIIELLQKRSLNFKNNNYIITELTPEMRKIILDNTINNKMLIENYDYIKEEYYISREPYLKNAVIDLSKIPVEDIFNLALDMLEIKDKVVNFEDWRSILKFRGLLKQYGKGIQFIFYNPGYVPKEKQILINSLFAISEYLYNSNFLLLENEKLSTYTYFNGKMLDSREEYMKLTIRR